jgi:hypothetical protein
MPQMNSGAKPSYNVDQLNPNGSTTTGTINPATGQITNPTTTGGSTQMPVPTQTFDNGIPQGTGGAGQNPGLLGLGIYQANNLPINANGELTGTTGGANAVLGGTNDGNFGLNQIWNGINNNLQVIPQGNANANAAQGNYQQVAQVNPATGQAITGTAQNGNSINGQAITGNAASMQAAQGQAASAQLATAQAAQAQAAQARAAQMQAAQSGYAQTNGATIANPTVFQNDQQQNIQQLQNVVNGTAPSVAGIQLQQGEQQQVANQLAQIGSQRGAANTALAQRQAAEQAASAQQNLAANQSLARQQEVNTAENTVGNVAGTANSQLQNLNITQAQLNQNTNNLNANLAQGALLQNSAQAQQAATTNANNSNAVALANMQNANSMISQNSQQQQATNVLNANNANTNNQFNANLSQNMATTNVNNQQAANTTNAGLTQGMNLANLTAQNNMASQNATAANTTNIANLGYNNQMITNNMNAQNQFGMQNLNNQQAADVYNASAMNTMTNNNIANQQQSDLANQQMTLQNATLNADQTDALLGAETGISESNRAADLSAEQLAVQQNLGNNQINANAYANAASNNTNLVGSFMSAVGAGTGYGLNSLNSNPYAGQNPATGGSFSNGGGTFNSSGGTVVNGPGQFTGNTSSTPGNYPDDSGDDTSSDENLKTGIEGGNPMLQSFLDNLKEDDSSLQSSNSSSSPITQSSAPQTTTKVVGTPGQANTDGSLGAKLGGAGGAAAGAAGGAALGTLIFPGVGTAIGGVLGGVVGGLAGSTAGNAVDSTTGSKGNQRLVRTTTTPIDDNVQVQSDAPSWQLSDDREKEAISSGSKGIQSFLQQANQQTNANNSGNSSPFQQQGYNPQSQNQADRPMPTSMPIPYGQNRYNNSSPTFGGTNSSGGVQQGSVFGGGITNAGGFTPGGYTQAQAQQTNGNGVLQPNPADMSGNGGMMDTVNGQQNNMVLQSQKQQWLNQNSQNMANLPANQQALFSANSTTGTTPMSQWLSSDEDKKTDTKEDYKKQADFLNNLHAYNYRYKNPNAPGAMPGQRTGVMAQDIEKSEIGKQFVKDTPNGKMVDYKGMLPVMMASQAYLNERINKLEGKKS